MLQIENVHAHYGKVYALQGVSLHVDRGETVAVLGANGAGKTTLLSVITGLLPPTQGEVRLEGQSLRRLPPHRICALGIGTVPEGRRVFVDMTVAENLAMGAYSVRDKAAVEKSRKLIHELFPILYDRRNQVSGTLSGGEQQMLAIGRALMSSPKLLLLDEPSLGLAPLVIQDIFHALKEINSRGTTVLLVEQSAHLALKVANRAYMLASGKVTLEGNAAELAQSDSLQKAYMGA